MGPAGRCFGRVPRARADSGVRGADETFCSSGAAGGAAGKPLCPARRRRFCRESAPPPRRRPCCKRFASGPFGYRIIKTENHISVSEAIRRPGGRERPSDCKASISIFWPSGGSAARPGGGRCKGLSKRRAAKGFPARRGHPNTNSIFRKNKGFHWISTPFVRFRFTNHLSFRHVLLLLL